MIKYYFRLDSLNENKPLTLYYVDDLDFTEKRFDRKNGKWVPSDKIYFAVISGDLDYEQVSSDDAKKFAPEAFD